MIEWGDALDRAQWFHDHGQFEQVPLHRLAERLQDLAKMCETYPVITPDKVVVTNLETVAANANT